MNNIFWSYGKEGAGFSAAVAVVGTTASAVIGGMDKMLLALIAFMALDFALGFLAAWKDGKVDSRIMLWGGVNKLLVLGLVAVGHILDGLLMIENPIIRTAVIWFYLGRELLSIFENYGKMGLPIAPGLSDALAQITKKGEYHDQNDRNH